MPLTPDLTTSTPLDRSALRFLAVPTGALFTAICAQIAVPTEPLGIPITLQTLAVLLCAMALGPKLGLASMALYIITGAVGVGVFAEGEAGIAVILGQSGGYLLGFLAAQPLAHALIKRPDGSIRGRLALFGAGLAVHLVIFAIGVPWLYLIRRLDDASQPLAWTDAIHYGFVVFIPGMLLKSGIAAGIAAWLLPHVARRLW